MKSFTKVLTCIAAIHLAFPTTGSGREQYGDWLDEAGYIIPGPKIRNFVDIDKDGIDDRFQMAAGWTRAGAEPSQPPKPTPPVVEPPERPRPPIRPGLDTSKRPTMPLFTKEDVEVMHLLQKERRKLRDHIAKDAKKLRIDMKQATKEQREVLIEKYREDNRKRYDALKENARELRHLNSKRHRNGAK